jgi:hypothetical protein
MWFGISTSPPDPKYRIRVVSAKSTKNESETLKNRFPGSTQMLLIPEPATASPVISRRLAGIQSQRSDEQPPNAWLAKLRIAEPGSNVKTERAAHPLKQDSEMVLIDAGREID